ncbi:hypothetical protein RRG08_053598 [Elysia crispata]|uniref:Uncharacterized protein n=1 Tax=Elysia crispata TaxID=231223 RepID=A0AAE0Y1E0_9GAST|nr:hypothetical protein RRG08_053598 [Elysia crispata]
MLDVTVRYSMGTDSGLAGSHRCCRLVASESTRFSTSVYRFIEPFYSHQADDLDSLVSHVDQAQARVPHARGDGARGEQYQNVGQLVTRHRHNGRWSLGRSSASFLVDPGNRHKHGHAQVGQPRLAARKCSLCDQCDARGYEVALDLRGEVRRGGRTEADSLEKGRETT